MGPPIARMVGEAERQPSPRWRYAPSAGEPVGGNGSWAGHAGWAAPPIAASGSRTRSPDPSLRPSGGGSGTGVPAAVAPRAGPGPAQASTSTSSPFRNRWQRTPPVARPLGGNSAYGVTFTLAGAVPGRAPSLPATVTTTGSAASPPAEPASWPAAGSTAPNQTTDARGESLMPAIPPAARPCGLTADAPNLSSWASLVTKTRSWSSWSSWTAPTTRSPSFREMTSKSAAFCG